MDILVNVANQKLKIATNLKNLVSGTQEFVRFTFNLTDDWDGLLTFAQFCQNGVAYNQYLDEENGAYLPSEIGAGTCTVMLYGSGDDVIATTNYLTLTIDENILVSDANSTEISTSLYNQLVSMVNSYHDKVDDLGAKFSNIENSEVFANMVETTVKSEMAYFLDSGYLANLTIEDDSITAEKLKDALRAQIINAYNGMIANSARIATVESGKADKSTTYTKTETDTRLAEKADLENGKVPASQLPAFVDDVLEGTYVDATEFDDKNGNPYTPEDEKLYVDVSPNSPYFNRTYRWSGSQYSEVSESLALGETASTAYAGNKGKKNADDIAELKEIAKETAEKITSINLFDSDAEEFVDGSYISPTTGNLSTNSAYFTTDYIPVEHGKKLISSYNNQSANMRFGAVFDSNKTIMSGGWDTNQAVFTVPQGAAFVRVSVSKTQSAPEYESKYMLEVNDDGSISPYVPYQNKTQVRLSALPESVSTLPSVVEELNVSVETVVKDNEKAQDAIDDIIAEDYEVICSYNRYDADAATEGYYVNEANGNLVGNPSYVASDYIEIKQGHKYAFASSPHWAAYNISKEFIGNTEIESVGSFKYLVAAVDGFIRMSSNLSGMAFYEVKDKTHISFLPSSPPIYVQNFYYDNKVVHKANREDFSVYLYNLMDSSKIKEGYYGDTPNANYDTTDFMPLPSVPLTIYKENLTAYSVRQVEYFDRDFIRIYSTSATNEILAETPTFAESAYFRYSAPTGTVVDTMTYPSDITPIQFLDYGVKILHRSYISPYLSASDAEVEALKGTNGLVANVASLAANTKLDIGSFPAHLKKNIAITADMKFNTFTGVKIGMGYAAYRGDWLEIDGNNVVYKTDEGSRVVATVAHGLTIADALSLALHIDNDGVCHLSMATNGGNVNLNIQWQFEQNGAPFVLGEQGMVDVKLSAVALDAKCPVWIFGDSFFGFAENRVMGQLKNLGYTDNILVDGMAGIGTSACLTDITRLIALGGAPKIVICCEGMNDGGSGYAQNLSGIISACEGVGAELILYKVPVVTARLTENTGVNTVVLASGKRYVDAYKAVGADGNGGWWSGYNADGVHPTDIGAKAIAQRIVIDVPELMQYGRNVGNITGTMTGDV